MSKQLRTHNTYRFALMLNGLLLFSVSTAMAGDWNVIPSTYSHDAQSGRRTTQYQPEAAAYYQPEPQVIRSGYRQIRGSIQVGGLSDNMHRVERWGEPVRPYGEWRFPYRPYSAPYPAWGPPPFAGPNAPYAVRGFGRGFRPGFGWGYGIGRPPAMPPAGGAGGGGGGGAGGGAGGGLIAPPGIDPRRLPVPATPDRWRPWHDGSYPESPRDYYQNAPEPYWPTR